MILSVFTSLHPTTTIHIIFHPAATIHIILHPTRLLPSISSSTLLLPSISPSTILLPSKTIIHAGDWQGILELLKLKRSKWHITEGIAVVGVKMSRLKRYVMMLSVGSRSCEVVIVYILWFEAVVSSCPILFFKNLLTKVYSLGIWMFITSG